MPADLTAITGAGLTTGHLLDLAARANKAEAAINASAAELAKLKTDRAVEVKKLNADREAAEKSLNDSYKADVKKLNDEHAVAMKKLTDAQAVELKKAADATTAATDKIKNEKTRQQKTCESRPYEQPKIDIKHIFQLHYSSFDPFIKENRNRR